MQSTSAYAVALRYALRAVQALLVLVTGLCLAGTAHTQSFPTKPVRVLSGQPPGGATDFFARLVGQKLTEMWKQPVIIEHRTGASGSIAVELVAKSPPDGHTLVFVTAGQIVLNPHLLKLPYDPLTDITPVAFLVHTCMLLTTHPSVPVKTVGELVALAKAHPDKLNFGSGGTGAPTHLAAELLMSLTGTRLTHVPYKGAGPAVQALVSGEVALTFGSVPATMTQAKAGRIRAIAISTAKRSQVWPELPTLAESGAPGFEMTSWYAFYGPPGMNKEAQTRAHADIGRVALMPDIQERLLREGGEHEVMTPERMSEFGRTEYARWGKIIRARNIRAQ